VAAAGDPLAADGGAADEATGDGVAPPEQAEKMTAAANNPVAILSGAFRRGL